MIKKTKKIEDQQKQYTKIDVLIPANNMEIGILSNQINEILQIIDKDPDLN